MAEPEIALVFSPEVWVEALHRYFTDHGGARVRQIVMEPGLALEEDFHTLVVSHRWPALTRPFVDALHQRRRTVLGVFDPLEPAGAGFLAGLGVDRVIPADAAMSQFLEYLHELAPQPNGATSDAELAQILGEPWEPGGPARHRGAVIALGGTSGAGATEISVHLAKAIHEHGSSVVLVDADEFAPSVGQRLGLPIEPNVRTAVDAVDYGMGTLAAAVTRHSEGFDVLAGIPNVAAWSQMRPGEMIDVISELRELRDVVVVNVSHCVEDVSCGTRGRFGVSRAVLAEADAVIGVGSGNPVGVVRLLNWIADVRGLAVETPVLLVVNRGPGEPFKRGEIDDEIRRTYPPRSLTFVPFDRRVDSATWRSELVSRGPFARAVDELARDVLDGLDACAGEVLAGGRPS